MAGSSSFQRQRGRWGSPERTVVWTEPKPRPARKKVAVVYYLCHHDGHLDHPHFLEMELPSPHRAPGVHLRDFTARLTALRGSGMPAMYSWSAKRSYRNGYVWQDLTDDDHVPPAHGNDEYVLKGSPLLLFPQPPPAGAHLQDDASPASACGQDRRAAARRRKNWSSFDLGDCDSSRLAAAAAQQSAAATQTDRRGRGADFRDAADPSTELAIDEISPPPSSSSPDGYALESCGREVGVIAGGRMRASAVLMQLFSCGSVAAAVKRGHARGARSDLVVTASAGHSHRQAEKEGVDAYASARAECLAGVAERDYFSGSLVESSLSKNDALLLKRSSSCNADRGAAKLKLPVPGKEARAGCLASRGSGSRAHKRSASKSTAAAAGSCRDDGGECKAATAVDGEGSSTSS